MEIFCYGCGKDLTNQATNRYNMLNESCCKVLPVWKKLVSERFQELEIDCDVNRVVSEGSGLRPKMCRSCVSSLYRYEKIEASTRDNIKEAVETMVVDEKWRDMFESRKRSAPSEDEEDDRCTCTCTCGSRSSRSIRSSRITASFPRGSGTQQSPDVAIVIRRSTSQKTYRVTPSRKKFTAAIARRSMRTVANECLTHEKMKPYAISRFHRIIKAEIKKVSTHKSVFCSTTPENLKTFSWKTILNELKEKAPNFLSILMTATETRTPRSNRTAVISLCSAILLKYRFKKMNLVQKVISLILYAGNCSKMVFSRLCPVGISVSYNTLTKLVDDLGKNHDKQVKLWRDAIITQLQAEEEDYLGLCYEDINMSSESDTCFSMSTSTSNSSITSHGHEEHTTSDEELPYSPITESDSEMQTTTKTVASNTDTININTYLDTTDTANLDTANLDTVNLDTTNMDTNLDTTDKDTTNLDTTNMDTTNITDLEDSVSKNLPVLAEVSDKSISPLSYKLVGDNIDLTINPRYMRTNRKMKSLHYYHAYAVQDRINVEDLSNEVPPLSSITVQEMSKSLLPSTSDDESIIKNIKMLFARILHDTLPFFKMLFDDLIVRHIHHRRYEEMSSKSIVVPLGVILKNENKIKEMVEILSYLHQYVPQVEYQEEQVLETNDTVQVCKAKTHHVMLGGDQLSVVRTRSALRVKANSELPSQRLEGISPTLEDWHAKLTFLEVIWKYFYSKKSSSEHGTLYQMRNIIGRTNVVNNPKRDMNSCEDFLLLSIYSYVTVAAMEILGLESVDEWPSQIPEDMWTYDREVREKEMEVIVSQLVNKFTEIEYNCSRESTNSKEDKILKYSTQLLTVGSIYLEFTDSIKEGDGERLIRCWKYLMIIFRNANRRNYAKEAVLLLHEFLHLLSPRQAERLIFSRFINSSGLPGGNISCDLHIEHLNRELKQCISPGSGKTENAVVRVGKALGTIPPILHQYDEVNEIKSHHTRHISSDFTKDLCQIVTDLHKQRVFANVEERKHYSFPNPKSLMQVKDTHELISWIEGHIDK